MSELNFFEPKHTYVLDGEPIPCVSDLCRFLSREIYKDAPKWQLEAAAERGTAVHAATVELDTTGSATVEESHRPYVEAYAKFLQEHEVVWSLTEYPDYDPILRYAGTIDRYGMVDGVETLVDLKTTYTVHKPLCAASLNLYRLILESKGHPVEKLLILHLKKDGTYKLVPFQIDDDLPLALFTIHHTLQKKRRKPKCPKN